MALHGLRLSGVDFFVIPFILGCLLESLAERQCVREFSPTLTLDRVLMSIPIPKNRFKLWNADT